MEIGDFFLTLGEDKEDRYRDELKDKFPAHVLFARTIVCTSGTRFSEDVSF